MKAISLGLVLAAAPMLLAHHSAVAEYGSKLILLKGTITKFDWMNPHVWIYLDATDGSGPVEKWECEGSAPNGLIDKGWRKDSLKPGDPVTIECVPAKDRPNLCKARAVTLANGRHLLMGLSE
jgi:hypothetical protein